MDKWTKWPKTGAENTIFEVVVPFHYTTHNQRALIQEPAFIKASEASDPLVSVLLEKGSSKLNYVNRKSNFYRITQEERDLKTLHNKKIEPTEQVNL